MLELQDNLLLFYYNVEQRVNNFTASGFIEVKLSYFPKLSFRLDGMYFLLSVRMNSMGLPYCMGVLILQLGYEKR